MSHPSSFPSDILQSDPLAALQLKVDSDLAQLVAAVVAATAVKDSFDSFPSPSASAYSLPTAIQEDEHKDPSLLHSLQVVVVLGLKKVCDLDSHKEYFQKKFQNLPKVNFYYGPVYGRAGKQCVTSLDLDEAMLATRDFWFQAPTDCDNSWTPVLEVYEQQPSWPALKPPEPKYFLSTLLHTKDSQELFATLHSLSDSEMAEALSTQLQPFCWTQ